MILTTEQKERLKTLVTLKKVKKLLKKDLTTEDRQVRLAQARTLRKLIKEGK